MRADGCTDQELRLEVTGKRQRLIGFMKNTNVDALLLSRHENIAWLTAGLADVRVGILRESGPASLLLTADNRVFYLTTQNEAQRLAEEEFALLDFTPVVRPVFGGDIAAQVTEVAGNARVGTDMPLAQFAAVSPQPLRYELTTSEIKRYRWASRQVADIVTGLLLELRPGISERAMQAVLAERLLRIGILPSVYLTAVDDRILRYKHAVPRDGVLARFAMLGVCARYGGLVVAMTRFAHIGEMPTQLRDHFAVVSDINARLQAATQPGASSAALYEVARSAYAEAGHAEEVTHHHQGGATGYMEREWFAQPGGTEIVGNAQAFAWNPNLHGAKAEDTVLLHDGKLEVLTATPELPSVDISLNGISYRSAGVLIV
jgi:Xaa-Pro dipeptidase